MHKIIVFSFLQVLLILSIGCKTRYTPVKSNFGNLKVQAGSDTIGRLVTAQFLKPYQEKLRDSFSTVLTTATSKFIKKRPGGSLGNLVTTSVLRYYHQYMDTKKKGRSSELAPVFILMNYGGIRLKEIGPGDITVGKVFELLPFENTLVRIQISGKQLATLLRQINKQGGWPCMDAHFPYDAVGLENASFTASMQEIEQEREILLITNNYIAQGGDNCSILKTLPQTDTQILLRNVVIDYLKGQKKVSPDNKDYIIK